MERERFTLALIVCLILTIFYINLLAPPPQNNNPNNGNPQNNNPNNGNPQNNTKDPQNENTKEIKKNPEPEKEPKNLGWNPSTEVQVIPLENEALKVELSSKGATLQKVWLKQYFYAGTDKKESQWKLQQRNWLQLLAPDENSQSQGSFGLKLDSAEYNTALENWSVKQITDESVEFSLELPQGPSLIKKYTLKKSPKAELPPAQQLASLYQIDFEIQIDKKNAKENKFQFTLNTARKLTKERSTSSYGSYQTYHAAYGTMDNPGGGTQAVYLASQDLKSFGPEGKIIERSTLENQYQSLYWAGSMDKFFACLLEIPAIDRTFIGQTRIQHQESYSLLEAKIKDTIDPQKKLELQARQEENITLDLDTINFELPQPRKFQWAIHCGPKDILESTNLKHVIDLGYFETFARWMIWILNTFQGWIGSYGFAIICLTILAKMIMFPLTRKQQVTMQDYTEKMNKIRPKMEKIKEKYANDRMKMNEATMELFREHKVQIFPFMGCIPLFIQLPIFFGIFSALQVYPPLRQAQWLWVNDLTAPDALFTFGTHSFWIIGNSFNLLPLLMTLTWIKQTSMMPKSDDPQMQLNQKMMKFMPIFIGFMMYSAPSGLTLYWFCSTLLGIFEQLYIKKFVKKGAVLPPPEKTSATTSSSGLVSKIEAMFNKTEESSFKKIEDKNKEENDEESHKRKHKKKK